MEMKRGEDLKGGEDAALGELGGDAGSAEGQGGDTTSSGSTERLLQLLRHSDCAADSPLFCQCGL